MIPSHLLQRIFPPAAWFREVDPASLRADFVSGLTVALVLIPQSMAYAQLAGLPSYYGLYASFLPPTVAALFGSSRQLATGPVAIVSLMTAATLEPLATAGSAEFAGYAALLALIVGLFQLAIGTLRLGMIVNFLSHPVVTGFTNAGALIIASTQLSKIFGVEVEKTEHHYETVFNVFLEALRHIHLPTLAFGLSALAVMLVLRHIDRRIPYVLVAVAAATLISWLTRYEEKATVPLDRIKSPGARSVIQTFIECSRAVEQATRETRDTRQRLRAPATQAQTELERLALQHEFEAATVRRAQLLAACRESRTLVRRLRFECTIRPDGTRLFHCRDDPPTDNGGDGRDWHIVLPSGKIPADRFTLMAGGRVVGTIPEGLPALKRPPLDIPVAIELIWGSIIIALLGFTEAISIAKAMAARTGQRLDPNQELIGQGLGCLTGAFTQGYPISGSFSRSAVNLQAGAATALSSVFSSVVVVVTLLFLTPFLYHLPQAVLAAVIMMAVIGLINPRSFIHAFRVHSHDGLVAVATFGGTLLFAPHLDRGIMVGVGLSLVFYLMRNMTPTVAMLSRHPSGAYRNAARWGLTPCRHITIIRFNGSLTFTNAIYLEDQVLDQVATMPELRHVHFVGNGINEIDASGEEVLSLLVRRLREANLGISISGLNDAVRDILEKTLLIDEIGAKNVFRNVDHALEVIHAATHDNSSETRCPLLDSARIDRALPQTGEPRSATPRGP